MVSPRFAACRYIGMPKWTESASISSIPACQSQFRPFRHVESPTSSDTADYPLRQLTPNRYRTRQNTGLWLGHSAGTSPEPVRNRSAQRRVWKRDVMNQTTIDGIGEISGLRQLMWGHALLLACAVLYVIWWCVFFNPNVQVKGGLLRSFGVACILVAAVAGIAGVALDCLGISGLSALPTNGSIRVWPFAIGGVAVYIALAAATSQLLHRPITTELLLIVMWVTLELCTLIVLYDSGALGLPVTVVLAVILLILFIADMTCYLAYYHLPPMPAFIDGTVPLIAVAAFSAVVVALLV